MGRTAATGRTSATSRTGISASSRSGDKSLLIGVQGQYVTVPYNAAYSFTDNLTIIAHIKPRSWGGSGLGVIVQKGVGGPTTGFSLTLYNNSNQRTYRLYANATTYAAPNGSIALGCWQRIAITFNKSLGSNQIQFYLNGAKIGDGTKTNSIATDTQKVGIGDSAETPARFADCLFDEVLMYGRTLTASEILDDYNGTYASNTSLVLHHKYDEGYGLTVTDYSSLANNGTIVGGAKYEENTPYTPGTRRTFGNKQGTITTYGDSYIAGAYATTDAQRATNILAANVGLNLVNGGIGGDQVADIASHAFAKTVRVKDQYLVMAGLNDMRRYGTTALNQSYAKSSMYATAIWLAIPDFMKIKGQSSRVTYVGTWINSSIYGGALGKQSGTSGDTATFTVSGSTIYICWESILSGTGQFTISVDGVSKGTFNSYDSAATANSLNNHPNIYRLSGLTNGRHVVVITISNSAVTSFLWAAGNKDIDSVAGADVYISDVIRMVTPDGYAAGGYNQGSDAAVSNYNSDYDEIATNLYADGLQVFRVDTSDTIYSTLDNYYTDKIHPNDVGHALIGAAYAAGFDRQIRRAFVA